VIQIPAQASVVVMHEPVSFRMGIDGMIAVARVVLAQEPMSGALFVFRNRRRQMLRILFYDGGGFWLCTRRLSKGTFSYWPQGHGTGPCSPLLARELQVLIWGGDPAARAVPIGWRMNVETVADDHRVLLRYRNREITQDDLVFLSELCASAWGTRIELFRAVCEAWGWRQANGSAAIYACSDYCSAWRNAVCSNCPRPSTSVTGDAGWRVCPSRWT